MKIKDKKARQDKPQVTETPETVSPEIASTEAAVPVEVTEVVTAAAAEEEEGWDLAAKEREKKAKDTAVEEEWCRQQMVGFQVYAPSLEEYVAAGYTAANYPPSFATQRKQTEEWHRLRDAQLKQPAKEQPKREAVESILTTALNTNTVSKTAQNMRSFGKPQTFRA